MIPFRIWLWSTSHETTEMNRWSPRLKEIKTIRRRKGSICIYNPVLLLRCSQVGSNHICSMDWFYFTFYSIVFLLLSVMNFIFIWVSDYHFAFTCFYGLKFHLWLCDFNSFYIPIINFNIFICSWLPFYFLCLWSMVVSLRLSLDQHIYIWLNVGILTVICLSVLYIYPCCSVYACLVSHWDILWISILYRLNADYTLIHIYVSLFCHVRIYNICVLVCVWFCLVVIHISTSVLCLMLIQISASSF